MSHILIIHWFDVPSDVPPEYLIDTDVNTMDKNARQDLCEMDTTK